MANPKIEVTVVVSGAPQRLDDINTQNKVEHLMVEALKAAGIHNPDISEWTLRHAEGGPGIDPESKIGEAGIANGAVLYLDPDEGGGGEVAAPPGAQEPAPDLVDPAVSAAKLERQLSDWDASREAYRRKGWFLLASSLEDLWAEVAFGCYLPIGNFNDVVAIPVCARFDFHNYDIWAPSVRLVDPIEGRWLAIPRAQALDYRRTDGRGNPQDAFIGPHPRTQKVFLCKRGVREYHNHFEHSGDDWLLYRGRGLGTLAQLCEVLSRLTTGTIDGLEFAAQRIPLENQGAVSFSVSLRQENVEELSEKAKVQLEEAGRWPPPEAGSQQ
jgi:hypothetical protein